MESPEHDDDRLRTMALVLAEAEHRVKTSITIISAWASTLDDRWDALTLEERRTGIHVIRERSDALKREATRLSARTCSPRSGVATPRGHPTRASAWDCSSCATWCRPWAGQ